MTPATLREIIEGLEVTQSRFAQLVGVQPRTVRAWLAGEAPVPRSVQSLALLWCWGHLDIKNLTVAMDAIREAELQPGLAKPEK